MAAGQDQSASETTANTDIVNWNWIRLESNLINPLNRKTNGEKPSMLPLSMELHYRRHQNLREFQNIILRPMVGYNINNNTITWLGYANIMFDDPDNPTQRINEQRIFQLITYNTVISKTNTTVLLGPRLEQRFLPGENQHNHRLRLLTRVSQALIINNKKRLHIFAMNEYFYRINNTQWSGSKGFDHNRIQLGLEYDSESPYVRSVYGLSYLNNKFAGRSQHGFSANARLQLKKKSQRRDRSYDQYY